MSFANVTSSRGVEIDGGSLYLSESQISQAIISQWFSQSSTTDSEVAEVTEIVAQLFDALEEKRSTEEADVAEYLDLQNSLDDEIATTDDLSCQINTLADFLLSSFPGEISQSEDVVDTAIRVIKNLVIEVSRLNLVNTVLNEEVVRLKAGKELPNVHYPAKSPFADHWFKNENPVPVPAIDWHQTNCDVTGAGTYVSRPILGPSGKLYQ